MATALHFAARSDVGLLREGNEDSGYAGPRLLAVADGVGGHVAGEVASSLAIATLAVLDEDTPGPDILSSLRSAVATANDQIGGMILGDPALEGMGTTLTALLRTGSRLAVVHVGDSRGYLLREGVLEQITHDHTFVQGLVDEGRITAEEASTHPQRNLITKALSGHGDLDPDLSIRELRPGDRYLVCSDGLSGVVSDETMHEVLTTTSDPDAACEALVSYALRAGGPDNVTVVVADVVDTAKSPSQVPQVVGAVADAQAGRGVGAARPSSAQRAAALRPVAEKPAQPAPAEVKPPRWPMALLALLVLAAAVGGGLVAWRWSQSQYYVGVAEGQVAIYRGLPQSLAGLELSSVDQPQGIAVADLPAYSRAQLDDGIVVDSLREARSTVNQLSLEASLCRSKTPPRVCRDSPAEEESLLPTAPPAIAPTSAPSTGPTVEGTPS